MNNSYQFYLKSINNMCRTCLNTRRTDELQSLFKECVQEMIMEFASIKVSKDDGLPSFICVQCVLQVNLAYSFKKQCEKADFYLRNISDVKNGKEDGINRLFLNYSLSNLSQKTNLRKIKSENDLYSLDKPDNCIKANIESFLIRNNCNMLRLSCTVNNKNKDDTKELILNKNDILMKNQCTEVDESMLDSTENKLNYVSGLKTAHRKKNIINIEEKDVNPNTENIVNGRITRLSKKSELQMLKNASETKNNINLNTIPCKQPKVLDIFVDPVIINDPIKDSDNNIKCVSNSLTKKKIYKCKECNRKFSLPGGLKVHLSKHGKKHKCKVCKMEFTFSKQWKEHMKTHPDYRPYNCKICKKKFNLTGSLTKHMRTHGGERKHLCNKCGKRFYEPRHLMVHMRTHTGEKPIVCAICGKRFSDPHGLAAHNKMHTGEKNHECNICQKRFAHSFVLKAHLRVHTGEKPFVCSVCEAAFGSSSYLTIHMRSHTQERPYKCTACPKSFTSKGALTAHTMTHTGEKRFQCSVCGKRAARAADLTTHMRSHTGEKPYACDQCPKRYHTSSNLAAHKRSHSGIRNYVCTECGKAFIDSRTLQCHIRTHTGERPYVCQYCGNRFTQSGQLAAHRKTHIYNISASSSIVPITPQL